MGETRYSFGHRGISRVTVYTRPDASGWSIEWWDDDGRHRKALTSVLGRPVTDPEVAKEAGRRLSAAQERKRNQQMAQALGMPATHTLGELLKHRHEDLRDTWTPKYAKGQERRRKWWLEKLGADLDIRQCNAAVVERIAREAQGKRSDRWRQDILRYLVDSFRYAELKLKWIEARHNLSAVKIPSAKGKSHPYSIEEAQKLIPALWQVHPVAGWIGAVAIQTGRRLSAIRTLKKSHVESHGSHVVICFPGETDKARKTGKAYVRDLPERTDWTVPTQERCIDWLHEAEKLAGVRHVKGRAWHGLKRLFATETRDMVGADKQAGTLKSTLEGHYVQDVDAPKIAVADRMAALIGGTPTVTTPHDPQEHDPR